MKFLIVLFISFLISALAACGLLNTKTGVDEAYPTPIQVSYPSPIQNQIPGIPYPQFNDGDEIAWTIAVLMLFNGEVIKVTQSDALKISLFLKDGRTLITFQPVDNEIMRRIDECGDPCKNIQINSK